MDFSIFLTKVCEKTREHLLTEVTPSLLLTYSKNGGNLGLELK